MVRVEALNHALRNISEDAVRYHFCWGSWHGPHAFDLPLADIVDVMLAVKAKFYSFEAANVRHEHEYRIWEHVPLPPGKTIMPGVVTHSTDLIEHPELVSERIQRFARLVGPRECHRELRLWVWRPHASADRVGQAQGAMRRSRPRQRGVVAIELKLA